MIVRSHASVDVAPVFLLGAGGMLAGELARLLELHPAFELAAGATRRGGELFASLHPHLASNVTLRVAPSAASAVSRTCSVPELGAALADALASQRAPVWLVLALPHGEAADAWRALRAELGERADELHVVDLSADYRLKDTGAYAAWYGREHGDPDELRAFVYGLPEAVRIPEGAKRIAAPGCFATALQLATLPAAAAGVLDEDRPWIYHALTGSSGSGVKPSATTHHPHRHANLWSYAHGGHRHEAELAQALERLELAPSITFLPHSAPWARGIHLTAVLPLGHGADPIEARAVYDEVYARRPFVDVVEPDLGGAVDLRRVVGSNTAALSTRVRNGALVVELTLDNLIKGGVGQALQAMNSAAGFPEELGLPRTGLGTI